MAARLYLRFGNAEIRNELARRSTFPATTEQMGTTVPQVVTLAELDAEIAVMRIDHPDRAWREWELALAREHYRLTPEIPFVRQVPRMAPKRPRRAGSRGAINAHAQANAQHEGAQLLRASDASGR